MSMPWINTMPEHWASLRAKNMFSKQSRPVRDGDDVVTCFRDGTVTLRKNRRTTGFTESTQWSGYQGIRKGDLVIHVMDAFAGSIGVSDSDGKSTPVYSVCTPKMDLNSNYYAYLLREMARTGFIQSLYRGIRERSSDFRFEVFAGLVLPLPPRYEQDQIVRFLDWKVSQINKLINVKRRQIALLQEMRMSFIEKKLSEIVAPQISLRHLGLLQNGISASGDFFTEGTPFITYGDVYKNDILPSIASGTAKASEQQQKIYSVEQGDIFFTRTSETIDEVGFSSICNDTIPQAVFSGFVIRFRPKKGKIHNHYARYLLRSKRVRNYFTQEMNFVTRVSLGQTLLKNLPILLPELDIQKAVANIFETKCSAIDKLTTKMTDAITLLNEYRTRLVSDVVTGKLDVRDVVVPEYEAMEDVVSDENVEGLEDWEGDEE